MSGTSKIDRPRRQRCAIGTPPAFTLVEMLLVLVIMAVLSTAVVVSLCGRRDRRALDTAAHDLTATISYASSQAQLLGRQHRLVLLDDGRGYRVEILCDADGQFVPVKGQAGMQRALPAGIRVASVSGAEGAYGEVPEWLEFGSGGCGFVGRIELRDEAGRSASMQVVGHTCQILVSE